MISLQGIPGVLCNHLVNRNRQISRLEINCINFNENCSVFTDKLPNLSQLSLLWMTSIDILKAFDRCPITFNFEKFDFHCEGSCPFVAWSSVFNAIGSKLNTDICMDLLLGMPTPTLDAQRMSVLKDSLEWMLKLANIQRCKVSSEVPFSLDFLLESKNILREVKLGLYNKPVYGGAEHEKLKDKQAIKFFGCERNMELSNIGQELPQLRKLKVIR